MHHYQKILKHFQGLCCNIASWLYPIQLDTIGNTVNSYLTFSVDKTHYGTAIAPFSVQLLQFFLATLEVS